MDWAWSKKQGRIGALEHLMSNRESLWSMTNDCWDAFNEPKAFWATRIAKAAKLKGKGKMVVYLLFGRMLSDWRAALRALGPDPSESGRDPMRWDYDWQMARRKLAQHYDLLLNGVRPGVAQPRQNAGNQRRQLRK